jgi:hypothetical protein
MTLAGSIAKYVAIAVGMSAFAVTTYVHDRDQRVRQDKVELALASARSDLAEARASLAASARPAAPLVVAAAHDEGFASAVAERVVAANEARDKSIAAVAAEADAPTAEQLAAREHAKEVVDAAVARGSLRRQDAHDIQRGLLKDPAGYAETMRQLFAAMNQGKLTVEDPRVLLASGAP